jgi:anti-sigma regulatory factor (Ser/Thr protein kinase)
MGERDVTPVASKVPLSAARAVGLPRRRGSDRPFHHEALFYAGGDQGFLEGTLPLVERAVDGEADVLVAVGEARAGALQEALGDRAGSVRFVDMQRAGRNPARIIPLWQEWLLEPGAVARLAIGEPVWPGRDPAELGECERHEALQNLAFDEGPGWRLLCPYDLDGLDDAVIEAARRTHPFLSRDGSNEINDGYLGANRAVRPFAGALPAPTAEVVSELAFTSDDELAGVRRYLTAWAAQQSLGVEQGEELVLAVNELTANSISHGGGRGILRVWRDGDTLLCEVQDEGQIEAPLVGRIRPTPNAHCGRGIWIANQLSDLLQIRSSPAGTVVRLHRHLV